MMVGQRAQDGLFGYGHRQDKKINKLKKQKSFL